MTNQQTDSDIEAEATGDQPAPDDSQAEATEATIEERLAAAEDRALRLAAEMQNVLNRTRREVADERRYGALGLARDLLPALDNVDRALEAAEKGGDAAAELLTGLRMVRDQIAGALAQHGCEPVPIDPGTEFDPSMHEAILQQPSPDAPAGTILMATQTGYRLHDRVVRPAQVIVSSGPPQA